MTIQKGNRLAVDTGYGFNLYERGRYVCCVATAEEASRFVESGEIG